MRKLILITLAVLCQFSNASASNNTEMVPMCAEIKASACELMKCYVNGESLRSLCESSARVAAWKQQCEKKAIALIESDSEYKKYFLDLPGKKFARAKRFQLKLPQGAYGEVLVCSGYLYDALSSGNGREEAECILLPVEF